MSLKIACYNVLAEKYVEPCKPMFKHQWESRKEALAKRIVTLDPDLICLQEVDRFEDLARLLAAKGYHGMVEKDNAIFYKKEDVDVTDATRIKALERLLLNEVADLFTTDRASEAMRLFDTLSGDSMRHAVYGETYTLAQKKGLKTDHHDFGRVAFHRQEGYDATNDLRIEAIKAFLSK